MRNYRDGPTGLYRYYDADDVLLYVGLTNSDGTRDSAHRRHSRWMAFAVRRVKGEEFANRDDALEAERVAIRSEAPIFNRAGGVPRRAIDYLFDHRESPVELDGLRRMAADAELAWYEAVAAHRTALVLVDQIEALALAETRARSKLDQARSDLDRAETCARWEEIR
jgi:hypothetical protein